MKINRFLSFLLIVTIVSFCACGKKTSDIAADTMSDSTKEPFGFEKLSEGSFLFTSGAGGWATLLTINKDGTFSGDYHDSEMGTVGADFDGTVYTCTFSGRFSEPAMIDENTYSMHVDSLSCDNPPGEEYIEDGIKYIYSEPYGIEDGADFTVFLPESDTDNMSEDFIMWAKNEYYFEGNKLPVIGLMTEIDSNIYGWMQMR